ncbi:MAG: hypothetical protein GXO76_03705 [Calditrichaeota bacterium]|nr:hypothetical protein [Calditrichota bacterium]
MDFSFKDSDIQKIASVLKTTAHQSGNSWRMIVADPEENRKLSVEIYSNIPIGSRNGNLISVYTQDSHLQLHFCTAYVVSESLGEVTFVSESPEKISGLIIESGASCSMYANVDRQVLSGDFTRLGPEVVLSGVALSLTEKVLSE